MKVSKEAVVVVSGAQESAEVSGEAVILDFDDGVYYGLNPVGSRIWELVQQERSVRDIYNTLLQEYDVEPELLEQDLFNLLGEMADRRLVKIQNGPSA